jgi:hypothetical protein
MFPDNHFLHQLVFLHVVQLASSPRLQAANSPSQYQDHSIAAEFVYSSIYPAPASSSGVSVFG